MTNLLRTITPVLLTLSLAHPRAPEIPPSILHAQALRNFLRSHNALCHNPERWNQLIRDLSAFPDSQVIIVLCAVDSASRPGHLLYLYDLETIPLRVWGTTGGNNTGDKGSSSPPIPKTESPIHHRLIITREELRSLRGVANESFLKTPEPYGPFTWPVPFSKMQSQQLTQGNP